MTTCDAIKYSTMCTHSSALVNLHSHSKGTCYPYIYKGACDFINSQPYTCVLFGILGVVKLIRKQVPFGCLRKLCSKGICNFVHLVPLMRHVKNRYYLYIYNIVAYYVIG